MVLSVLQFNPAIDRYLHAAYGHLFAPGRVTTSVHLRVGYKGEPASQLLAERGFPPKNFMERSISKLGQNTSFLIFADDIERARTLFNPAEKVRPLVLSGTRGIC